MVTERHMSGAGMMMMMIMMVVVVMIQGGSNMTGTVTGLFTHKQSRSYLNHLVLYVLNVVRSEDFIDHREAVVSE